MYGSRGRGDHTKTSDYELGVVFTNDHYVQRAAIHRAITNPLVKAYPFKYEELTKGTLDFLFQKSLYLRELKQSAKTLYGEDVISLIPEIPITTLDLVQRIRFDIGLALGALLSYRSGDLPTSMEEFTKSCFYGVRSLAILEHKRFPIGYAQIFAESKKVIHDKDGLAVIAAAHDYREHGQVPSIDILYDNISLLDSLIEPRIVSAFETMGTVELI